LFVARWRYVRAHTATAIVSVGLVRPSKPHVDRLMTALALHCAVTDCRRRDEIWRDADTRPTDRRMFVSTSLKFDGSSFLVAFSRHPRRHDRHARHPREDATRMSRVSGDFPFSLPRSYLIGRPAVCCGFVLPVCPCVGSFCKFHEPATRSTCCGQVASILVASSPDTSDTSPRILS